MTTSTLDNLTGQPHASRLLAASLKAGRNNHAYLLAGPPGVGKLAAARLFAAALCCTDDGCGVCPDCLKGAKGIHPDISLIEPAGAQILIDQIREINHSVNLHPSESRARVFIIRDAERLNAEAANAFLKSLEEPPPFVFFLLTANRADSVLPTIASRCQLVRFNRVPEADIEQRLLDGFNTEPVLARAYARASGGSISLADALASDPDLARRRERYLEIAGALCKGAWEGGAGELAAELQAAAEQAGEQAAGDTCEEELPEGFSGGATKKQKEQDAHRRSSAAQKRELKLALDVMESWFRDMMVTAAGAKEAIVNTDYEYELQQQALASHLDNYRHAIGVLESARAKLGYNIDLSLFLSAMFYQLLEVL